MIELLREQFHSADALQLVLFLGLASLIVRLSLGKEQLSRYALHNGKESGELLYNNAKMRFVANAQKLIQDGLDKVSNDSLLIHL